MLFRLMTVLGLMVIAIAVFSYLQLPYWHSSKLGFGVLVICLALGGFAILMDLRSLWRELQRGKQPDANNEPEDSSKNDRLEG